MMKKLSFIFMAISSLVAMEAIGQDSYVPANSKKTFYTSVSANEAKAVINKSDLNAQVVKNFKKQFPVVSNDVWTRNKQGYFVGFSNNDIQTWAFLSRKGNCTSYIRYYNEKNLPVDIRHQVKTIYYDFSITSVKEVTHNNQTVYLITLENNPTWKVIRIAADEMDVWEEHQKS